jgi:hypothetical protein
MAARFTVELFGDDGRESQIILYSDDRLEVARELFHKAVVAHPGRSVALCDVTRVITRSEPPGARPK